MTTQEIAIKLVQFYRSSNFKEAWDKLFGEYWTRYGSEKLGDSERHGKKDAQKWQADVEEIHEIIISDPIVSDNSFVCTMMMDITSKTRGRNKEIKSCVYKVKDGKIISERFF